MAVAPRSPDAVTLVMAVLDSRAMRPDTETVGAIDS